MVDFLYDLDARLWWYSVSAEFAAFIVVVAAIEFVCQGTVALWYMNGSNLEVVLCLARGVRAEKQSVDGVGLVWGARERAVRGRSLEQASTHDSLSGNHWHVKLGQSNACVMTRSYRYGAFFFLGEINTHSVIGWYGETVLLTMFCTPARIKSFSSRR